MSIGRSGASITERVNFFADVSFLSGSMILFFVASLFLFSGAAYVLKIPGSPILFYLCVLSTAALLAFLALKYFDKKVLPCALIVLSAVFLFSALSYFFYDTSYDGQVYHQETIVQLARGWNPFFETLSPANPVEGKMFQWSQNYAKAAEIAQGCIYMATHRIESGKTVNCLLIFASFFLAVCSLCTLKKMSLRRAILFAAAAALNPIAVCQAFSYYIDGQLASLALCLLCLLALFYKRPSAFLSFLVAAGAIYFINIKFTGVIYFAVMAAGFLAVSLLHKKMEVFKKALVVFTVSGLLGVFVFGYNPYVRNFKEHGHPFFPIMGEGKVDIMAGNRPIGFDAMTKAQRLWTSLAAKAATFPEQEVKVKLPLTLSKQEIMEFGFPDIRLGGFGPFFSGALLLSLIALVLSFARAKENRTLYAVLLFLLLSVFINPENWWARYVPQLWFAPLLTVIFAEFGPAAELAKKLTAAVALLILFNVGLIGSFYLYRQTKNTVRVRHELKQLSQMKMPLRVDFSDFRSNRVRFEEYGLQYVEVSGIQGTSTQLISSLARVENG